jgi:hypothetical protein
VGRTASATLLAVLDEPGTEDAGIEPIEPKISNGNPYLAATTGSDNQDPGAANCQKHSIGDLSRNSIELFLRGIGRPVHRERAAPESQVNLGDCVAHSLSGRRCLLEIAVRPYAPAFV